jgi:predicted permease
MLGPRLTRATAIAREFIVALPVAARSMRRNPGFFVIAVSSLAVALGLSTSVFAHIDSLTHPNVPVRDVDRLYRMYIYGAGAVSQPTGDEIAQFVSQIPSFEGVAMGADSYGPLSVGEKGGDAGAVAVPPEYFSVLGITPRLGRLFSASENEDSGVAVVSDLTWKLLFNNRSEIGNAVVTFGERPYAVVGVLRPGLERMTGATLWLPRPRHYSRYTYFTARLKQTATEAQARADLKVVTDRFTSLYGTGRQRFGASFKSAKPDPLQLKAYHGAMIGAAVCILIIACANVAALMLARGVVRRRDQALRLSLGATRADLLTSVAAEVCILALAGGIAGVLLASWTMHAIAGVLPETAQALGIALEAQWTWRVFMESFAAMIVAVALAASLPAWYASRIAPSEPLKESSGTTTGRAGSRFRLLMTAEIALSMVLLMGSSLIAKATRHVSMFDFGYDARPLFVATSGVSIRPDSALKSVDSSNAAGKRRPQITETQFQAALSRVRGINGVLAAAAFTYGVAEKFAVISDQSRNGVNQLSLRQYMNVGDGFMKTIGLAIVEGRDFEEGDRARGGAVILDQLAAKQLFPHGGAVGRLVKLGDETSKRPWLPVVGIAHSSILKFPSDAFYEEEPQVFASLPIEASASSVILVRPRGNPTGPMLATQRLLKLQFPPKSYVQTQLWLDDYEELLAIRQFTASIFIGLGLASLALAAAGLFSVLSYSVGQRMREFAVRVALGAGRRDLMRLVLSDGLVMALGGTAVGAIFGMWGGFLLESFLFGVSPVDAQALVIAEAILFSVTMASCIAPALRATRADPLEILRAT